MTVILPEQTEAQIGQQNVRKSTLAPTLYLLHGLSDDDTIWLRRTSIERYVAPLGLAVVMPQVHRSYYSDMVNGNRYWTFLSEELPKIARSFFPLSDKCEDNFVAGLSMGGYGAMKWALSKPQQFAAVASMSGALDVVTRVSRRVEKYEHGDLWSQVFGDRGVKGTPSDLFWLLNELTNSESKIPKMYQCCGTEDHLYQENLKFRAACEELGVDLTYEEGPGGHDWAFWDKKIQDVLAWLPL